MSVVKSGIKDSVDMNSDEFLICAIALGMPDGNENLYHIKYEQHGKVKRSKLKWGYF